VANRILRSLTKNWALKLAAVSLAVLLWMAVRAGTPRATTFRNIPVNVDLRDPDWRLAEPPQPPVVQVTVIGPTGELLTLAGQPPRIVLLVDRVTDTVETQVLPLQWVQLPRDVRQARVLSLRPDTILLRYERLITRTLPVRVRTVGELPAGYELALPPTTSPARVQIRGPVRILDQLDSVPLAPVEISGLRSTTNIPASIDTMGLGPVRVSPEEVNVILRVVPAERVEPEPAAEQGSSSRRRSGARF
jgi:YbbR domain-containing protein